MNNIFSENLKKLRNSKQLTQEQVAEALKVSPQSVSRWECGNTFPDILLLPEIARLYSVTVDDLYRDTTYAYPNYAARLAAVYEESHAFEDFVRLDAEYNRILKTGQPTMDDLRLYAISWHQLMHDARRKALSLYDQALARGPKEDSEIYYRIKRQKAYDMWIRIAEEGERDGFEIESKMPRERAAKCKEKM